ncbi:serine hydrolase domain-containing protein [Foetidibacter luteolus]|uniref:serine hydrolase domain-containing protein n=1 Tax=Foetidibacter luteolus TaxID=2608880 RepID=UPI00129B9307|nr:serine hydrolase domain-containing protein [Foetidibacter luteolus]
MIKKIFFYTTCFLLVIIAGRSTAQKATIIQDKSFAEIQTFLQSLIDTAGIPGIAIAITKDTDIVYTKAFGVKNTDTKKKLEPYNTFHIASISKTFTATAVMQLYETGKIDINKPLVTYLPYFKMKDERYKDITIKEMLNHTSGMPDVDDYEWYKGIKDEGAAERYARSLSDSMLISKPVTEFHYSNIAFDIMADLIAKVSGMSFEKYVKENILTPLEMYESSFYYPEIKKSFRTSPHIGNPPKVIAIYPYNRMHAPSSTLNTNVLEMSHWAIANMYKGKYKSTQILTEETHAMMMTPTFVRNKEQNISIGLSWFMYPYKGMTNYEHGGSDDGYRSLLTLIPEKKIGIIILSNIETIRMYDTRNKIRDILLEKYKD